MRTLIALALIVIAQIAFAQPAHRKQECEYHAKRYLAHNPEYQKYWLGECLSAFTRYPDSRCAIDNLPCGRGCYNIGSMQACENGQVVCTPEGRARLRC